MKRILITILTLLSIAVLVGCNEDIVPVDTTLDDAYRALKLETELSASTLPSSINDVPINWTASKAGILDGYEILPQTSDIELSLMAELTYEGKSLVKTFQVTILGDTEDPGPDTTLDDAYEALTIQEVLATSTLPTSINGVPITWTANVEGILVDNEIMTLVIDTEVILTATLTYEESSRTKHFTITVLRDSSQVEEDLNNALNIVRNMLTEGITGAIETDLDFPTTYNNITITYLSSDPDVISDSGVVVRPDYATGDISVDITVTLELEGLTKIFNVNYTVAALPNTDQTYTGYYAGADGLSGEVLKTFLHNLIDDHIMRSYSQLWEDLEYTDEDPNNPNNVLLIYSQISIDEDSKCSATCPSTSSWNREHVWPKSHGGFDTGDIEGTDLHHIRPSLTIVNSTRGNLDFDDGGSLVSNTSDSFYDSDSFEPPEDVKGDIARMVFYMAVRYEGDSGELDLELNDLVNNGGAYLGRLSVLLLWHIQDPVDDYERTRNDRIYEIQGNRNPFIDHPEFVYLIWN